jgi:hypothetical protein
MHRNAVHDPQIPPDAKTQDRITCSHALFMETTMGPLEHEKLCVDISRRGCIGMHYMTHGSQRM